MRAAMSNRPTDTPPEQSLTPQAEGSITPKPDTDTITAVIPGNWLTKTLSFTGEAITEEADRNKWYKVVSYILNLVSIAGLLISTTVGYVGPWQLWFVLFFVFLLLTTLNAVRNFHERRIAESESQKQLAKPLADDGDKPQFRGKFHQVYIEDFTLEEGDFCFFITVQVSLVNVRKTIAAVESFSLRVLTAVGEHVGIQAATRGLIYREAGTIHTGFEDIKLPLDKFELPRNPSPEGYRRGIPESEKWLRFKVGGYTADEFLKMPNEWQAEIRRIALVVIDSFGDTHEAAIVEPPWPRKGEVEFSHELITRPSQEFLNESLAYYSDLGGALYDKCITGSTGVDIEENIKSWETLTAKFLQEYLGAAHRVMFINTPPDTSLLAGRTARDSYLIGWVKIRLQKLNQIIEEQRGR